MRTVELCVLSSAPFLISDLIINILGMSKHRTSSRRKRSVTVTGTLTLVLVTAVLTFVAVSLSSHQAASPLQATSSVSFNIPQFHLMAGSPSTGLTRRAGRMLFPYSVVPGGVESPQELGNAMGNDSTVALHYAGFNEAGAQVVSLDKDLHAYVSYRIGQEIFWTKKQVTIHKGETLITDGNVEARARCGNRVSATPQLPLSSREPTPEALETPQMSEGLSSREAPIEFALNSQLPNLVAGDQGLGAPDETNGGEVSPDQIAGMMGATSVAPSGSLTPLHPDVPVSAPIATPEPGTGLLLLLALATGWLFLEMRLGAAPMK